MDDHVRPDTFTRRSVRFSDRQQTDNGDSHMNTDDSTSTVQVPGETVPDDKLTPGEVRSILRRPVLTWSEGVVPRSELRKAQSFCRTSKVPKQRKRSNSAAAQFLRKLKHKNEEGMSESDQPAPLSPRLSGRFVVIPAQDARETQESNHSEPATSYEPSNSLSNSVYRQSMRLMTRLPSTDDHIWVQNRTGTRSSLRQAQPLDLPMINQEDQSGVEGEGGNQINPVMVTSLLSVVTERLRESPEPEVTSIIRENERRSSMPVRPRQQRRPAESRDRHRHRRNRRQSSARTPEASSSSSSSSESLAATTTTRTRRREPREIRIDADERTRRKPHNHWPHEISPIFAFLACTVGLLSISRFSILSVIYGGNFIVQFALLSIFFGIPLFCFFACLGKHLGKGILDMWVISPVFRGIGIAMLFCQIVMSVYTILGTAYVFFYFRDSLIAVGNQYKWGKCFEPYRGQDCESNSSSRYEETVPDFFHGAVLQRDAWDQGPPLRPPEALGSIKFEIAFNLAVVWLVTFISISKGMISIGKSVIVFGTVPIVVYMIVAFHTMSLSVTAPPGSLLDQTAWNEFFVNPWSWISAAREVFMTWAVNAVAIMNIASKSPKKTLCRNLCVTVLLTLMVLVIAGIFSGACVELIRYADPRQRYDFSMSSYETAETYKSLERIMVPYSIHEKERTPLRNSLVTMYLIGGKIIRRKKGVSGYMVMRQELELFPSVTAILGSLDEFPPVWPIIFYLSLAVIGMGQHAVIWHSINSAIISINFKKLNEWETPLALLLSLLGFFGSLIFATSGGISAIHFMDVVFGSGWINMVLCVSVLFAILVVRGRPYSGESIVSVLGEDGSWKRNFFNPLLAFLWSVLLPIGLIVLAITSFRVTSKDIWSSRDEPQLPLWSWWVKQFGCGLQLIPILIVPLDAVVIAWKTLTDKETRDTLQRVQNLYRPDISSRRTSEARTTSREHRRRERSRAPSRSPSPPPVYTEPPPKYTPPPTYNTATGARIAKLFRDSIRRIRSALPENQQTDLEMANRPAPPSYSESIQQVCRSIQSSCQNTLNENQMTISELNQLLRTSVRRSIRALRGRELRREPTETTLCPESEAEPERPRAESNCSESVA